MIYWIFWYLIFLVCSYRWRSNEVSWVLFFKFWKLLICTLDETRYFENSALITSKSFFHCINKNLNSVCLHPRLIFFFFFFFSEIIQHWFWGAKVPPQVEGWFVVHEKKNNDKMLQLRTLSNKTLSSFICDVQGVGINNYFVDSLPVSCSPC